MFVFCVCVQCFMTCFKFIFIFRLCCESPPSTWTPSTTAPSTLNPLSWSSPTPGTPRNAASQWASWPRIWRTEPQMLGLIPRILCAEQCRLWSTVRVAEPRPILFIYLQIIWFLWRMPLFILNNLSNFGQNLGKNNYLIVVFWKPNNYLYNTFYHLTNWIINYQKFKKTKIYWIR